MGNLEKAGVLVVVALLAVILVVAFLNFPEQRQTPMLGAAVGKQAQSDAKKVAKPKTDPAAQDGLDVIRPKPEIDRSSSGEPPVLVNDPLGPVTPPPAPPKKDVVLITPTPPTPTPAPTPDAPDGAPKDGKKPVSAPGYPKTVKVQAGETLWAIAVREYGAKIGPNMVGAIADANPKVRPAALKAGTEISLPPPPAETGAGPSAAGAPQKPVSSKGSKSEKPASKEGTATPPKTRRLPFLPE